MREPGARLPVERQVPVGLRAAEWIRGVVIDRRRALERAGNVQPPRDEHASVRMQPAGPEALRREGLVAALVIETQLPLTDEVETDARHYLELGAALRPIVRQRRPRKWRDALDPAELSGRIEIHLAVVPRPRDADAVEERGVHLKAAIEMFDEVHHQQPARVEGPFDLRAAAARSLAIGRLRRRVEQRRIPCSVSVTSAPTYCPVP